MRNINKQNYIKSYATMSVELLNLACYRVQTISNEGARLEKEHG